MGLDLHAEVLRVRARLNARLLKAWEAVQKAEKGLNTAMAVYTKKHDAAAKRGKQVPSREHQKLVNGITKAREKLTKKLQDFIAVEEEWKEYFRRL